MEIAKFFDSGMHTLKRLKNKKSLMQIIDPIVFVSYINVTDRSSISEILASR